MITGTLIPITHLPIMAINVSIKKKANKQTWHCVEIVHLLENTTVKRYGRGSASRRAKTPEKRVVEVPSPYSREKVYRQLNWSEKAHCSDVLNYKLRLQKLAQSEEPDHALVVLQKNVNNTESTIWTRVRKTKISTLRPDKTADRWKLVYSACLPDSQSGGFRGSR